MNDYLLVLKSCSLFKDLSEEEILNLLNQIKYKVVEYNEKEVIFSPLKESTKIGIILSGSIDIQKIFPDGKMIILDRKNQGESIAEPSIFAKYKYYPSTACANMRSSVMLIDKENLEKLFSLNHKFLINYLEKVSNLTLDLKHKIGILSLDSIKEKIAGYLIHDYKINKSLYVKLPFSKKDWAEYMDVSRTSLSRELKKLQEEGSIVFNKRNIEIINLEALEDIIFC